MPIDASIYNLLAQPRKSAFDYAAEYEQQDANRLAQAQSRQLNALQIGAAQDQASDRMRLRGEQEGVRTALSGLPAGADLKQRVAALRGLGTQTAITQADAWEKDDLARREKQSTIDANEAKRRKEQFEFDKARNLATLSTAIMGRTPDHIRSMVAKGVQDGIWSDQEAASILEDLPMDGDPAKLMQWRGQAVMHAMSAQDFLAEQHRKAQEARAARADAVTAANKPFTVGPDGQVVPNQAVQAYELNRAAKGAAKTQVEINTGQKGFENESKLRDNFKAEPVYKAHQEMDSAHRQIIQALTQANPIGDMAAATKIMKLLDPGSVVRESELGMAMAATGLMDRVLNYADNIIKGTKLTPSQRKEFAALADKLYGESVSQFDAKRNEYIKLGGEYGLNAERALGPVARQTRTGGRTGNDGSPAAPAGAASGAGTVIRYDANGKRLP